MVGDDDADDDRVVLWSGVSGGEFFVGGFGEWGFCWCVEGGGVIVVRYWEIRVKDKRKCCPIK